MQRIRKTIKRAFTPVTIMLIPHSNARSLRLIMPFFVVVISIILCTIGSVYVYTIAIDAFQYKMMKKQLDYYSGEFMELKSTLTALKKSEYEFKKLFSLKTKKQVLENLDTSDNGSTDIENIKEQIRSTMENIGEIKDYLSQQRDIYMSTPSGWPADGHITSLFGNREHPASGKAEFHSGIDIAADPGRPVRATADGIVSFAGWSGGNGNIVVLEHGFKFSTLYGHNKMVAVRVGQKVKRGDIISYIGSTGYSTGPHVHYEVWQQGHPINPDTFGTVK